MRTIFYVAWLGIPFIFFTLALWSKLEEMSGLPKKDRPGDLMRQGGFMLICGCLAVGFDYFFLDSLYVSLSPPFVPFELYELLLLPVVLLVAAKFIGPSKDIKISKAPNPSKYKKR